MSIITTLLNIFLGPKANTVKQEQVVIASDSTTPTTVGALQGEPMSAWGDSDIVKRLTFCATLQLRTPLRVLLRHGAIHLDIQSEPPIIAREDWEGIWLPQVSATPYQGEMASDVGPVRASDYLPFLLAIREIVEANEPIESRVKKLQEMPLMDGWKTYVEQYGPSHISNHKGMCWVTDYFFPRFLDTIPKLGGVEIEELSRLGLDTANSITDASDECLLSIKGIGRAKLQKIRSYCASVTDNRDSKRLDEVVR
jgi:hypothetical protein